MKKQSGFTLIELMVVMAIIAILATAGLSAYTGYIKKARDTTRIADLAAMNTIVMGSLSTNGSPPSGADFVDLVESMNNNVMIVDPLGTQVCRMSPNVEDDTVIDCIYTYLSDEVPGGPGQPYCTVPGEYAIIASFESPSNVGLYTSISIGDYYLVGNCTGFAVSS